MGACDIGQAILPDGRQVWTTWGRGLPPDQEDWYRRRTTLELIAMDGSTELVIPDRMAAALVPAVVGAPSHWIDAEIDLTTREGERTPMQLINMTPHPIHIHTEDGEVLTIEPSGTVPRLTPSREAVGQIDGISVVRTTLGEPEGLPEPQEGSILVVSALVAEHQSVAARSDLAYPGEAIRDSGGRIIGCRGLCAGPGLAHRLRSCDGDLGRRE